MASKTLHSSNITFMDTTDDRKLDIYISSNHPTVQLYNSNTKVYTPDWSTTNLQLSVEIYLDSNDVTTDTQTDIGWYTKIGTTETLIGTGTEITVSTNDLVANPIITYICKAEYQNIDALSQITFARVDTGLNGTDGTSVRIKGTATSVAPVANTSYYTVAYAGSNISSAELNDSYMYNGDLYVCVDSRDGVDYFVNVGRIQGPAGENAKNIILSGSAQVFKVSKTNTVTPPTISVTAHTFNTSATTWTYSVNGGQTFINAVPTGVTRNGNIVTVTGSTLATNSLVVKASDGTIEDVFTIYKASDGIDGGDGDDGDPAPLAFLTNENISFAANASGQVALTSFTTNVVAYIGTAKTTPTIGTITGLPTGMTVSAPVTTANELILTFSIANNSTLGAATSNSGTITIPVTSPVSTNLKLNWSKINTGATGAGIKSTTVTYGVSESSATHPTEWQSTIPVVEDGKYLWTRTIIDYTDDTIPDTVTYIYAKQGTKGDSGTSGSSVTVSSIQYQSGASATTAPTGTWSSAVVAAAEGQYLWTKTTFSDNKVAYGVAKQGVSGTAASLVDITPSALYFKSTTGKDGTFTPEYIYLYPRFQTVTYGSWQYSVDGGTTWAVASGANGLTIGTYNSVANSLRISRSSTLYTDTITSISFKCNSNNNSVYDTVSIAKIYDVVDLQVGGKNLIIHKNEYVGYYIDANGALVSSPKSNAMRDYISVSPGEVLTFQKENAEEYFRWCWYDQDKVFISRLPLMTNQFQWTVPDGAYYIWVSYPSSGNAKIERGNTATDYSPAPEDIIEEASNINVMLSNEVHLFESTASGVPTAASVALEVVGYKGSILSETTVGTIAGLPSAGMTVTITDNGTTNTKITVDITPALTSDIADYGTLTIPITVNDKTVNKMFSWSKAKAGEMGASGEDSVTFQVYSNNGYALSINTPTITLQTFAYSGDTEITAGATYQWYSYNDGVWSVISGETLGYLDVSREDVSFSNSYMCKMTFNGVEYTGVATVDDKNDSNAFFSSKPTSYTAGDFWFTAADYSPPGHSVGTLLRAEHTNSTYSDDDWVVGSKYDAEIAELKKDVDNYNQFFSFDSVNGLKIGARDDDGNTSQFSTTITNTQLAFNYGDTAMAYIDGTSMHIKEAEIESPLTVTGKYSGSTMTQAPIINIGNFSIVVESNGSLSIVANT